ncbi:TrmH family RNA methyltransferase [Tenacibaculum piscium]|uniref:TrmH family RNA methyltransferase n=1 Tax=Tenacibaculum piscium TaxID=1458515 RepID=UPI001EFBC489|nr:RNA methyltransferase [Tenacibaculum piscium]MCG8184425.1 RNA methyltransferase [Tenacibaculum piscium]MCG8205821.1 RNA methyltransferase [Tenacibaculum piscium]
MNKQTEKTKSTLRKKADEVKDLRCKNLIVVLEEPTDIKNIGTVVRNINALGVEKLYIVDGKKRLPEDWQEMRERKSLLKPSVSAIKWSFVKTFFSTQECIEHLEKNRFTSIATSPHTKGKTNLYLQNGDYTQKRLAVWFGNEARGISNLAVENCKACVQIQMAGIIESMNLATSTGIVLYEITKQRREYQAENKRGRKNDPEIIAE